MKPINVISSIKEAEENSTSKLKQLEESVKNILKQCNAKISYVDGYNYSGRDDKEIELQIGCRFSADAKSKYSNDVSLYGKLYFNDNLELVKSDLTTGSGPNVLNYDFIKALNALYEYFESGNKHYSL